MLIRKAFKYKLRTTPDVEAKLAPMAGSCRFVWNKALAMNLDRLRQGMPLMWYSELCFWLKLWRHSDDMAFLGESHSQVLQQSLKNLDRAFKDAFDKTQPGKRIPAFKKRGVRDSFRYPQGFKFEGRRVFLPKIGWVGYFNHHRKFKGRPKNVTVSREADGWYMSVQVEIELKEPVHPSRSIVGGDRGVANLLCLSSGEVFSAASSLKALWNKLSIAQRKLSRMVKFSANWKKQQIKVAKIYRKMARVRQDRLHWISTRISKNHAIVVLENLKVAAMSKSAKGTIDQPGKSVGAKSSLNRSILAQGWTMLANMLEYKQAWRGGRVLYVPAHHTSQTCPVCQHVSADNRRTQASFRCVQCGYSGHADFVAATNILARGHRVLACGETVQQGRSMKQEPVRERNRKDKLDTLTAEFSAVGIPAV